MLEFKPLAFKTNFPEVVVRHRALQRARRGALIRVHRLWQPSLPSPVPPLEQIDFQADPLKLARLSTEHFSRLLARRADSRDDSIPVMCPRFGSAIFGGMITGALSMGSDTSWIHEAGATLEEVGQFAWGGENAWTETVVATLNYMNEKVGSDCYCYVQGFPTPLELMAQLRGQAIYYDVYDAPDKVVQVLDRCFDAIMWAHGIIDRKVNNRFPGICAGQLWMERGLPFLSDDFNVNLSADHYRQYGLPYTERIYKHYGGGFLHIHCKAYHQKDVLAATEGLTMFNWRPDPNVPLPHESFEQWRDSANHKIVWFGAPAEFIRANVAQLREGRFFIDVEAHSAAEEEAIIDFVHRELPIE
jgi:hypothetical protein